MIRTVARRILADPERVTPSSKAARLSRAGELSPADHLAVMYGKPAGGHPWQPTSLKNILLSEATLGYLMHAGRPVIGKDGKRNKLKSPYAEQALATAVAGTFDHVQVRTARSFSVSNTQGTEVSRPPPDDHAQPRKLSRT
ncbi:hypothetical protein RB628_14500 [Streptomyces sp. ADMS]|uniref:hypothetical protein n=1 Tax=Streptomyces sp. ADMS TaxID=3071415 RepID=UPI00296F312A|nr:hypothetical protein [Streptomyces sp. ADMS]MDW4906511.1 hypothetical protein [Streptomyces sp. ADMS]